MELTNFGLHNIIPHKGARFTVAHLDIRNKKKFGAIFFVLVCTLIVIALIFFFTTRNSNKEPPPSSEPVAEEPGVSPEPPAVSREPASAPPSPSPSPEKQAGPDLEAREAVDDSFFEDAAMAGNSLMDGFKLFSGLTSCDYYSATSMTVVGVGEKRTVTLDNGTLGTILDGLAQKPYGKIYILLGINEIGYEVSTFIDYYTQMLDTIRAAQPETDIYILGLTPVSQAKSNSSDLFNMTRIGSYNEALHQLAADKGCYYMDLVSALAGTDGFLPAAETTDGVHFSPAVYKLWLDYLKTHYA